MKENNFYVPTSKKNHLINFILSTSLSLVIGLILYLTPEIPYVSVLFFVLYYLSFNRIFEYLLTGKIIGGYGSWFLGKIMEGYQAKFYFDVNLWFIIAITAIGIYYSLF